MLITMNHLKTNVGYVSLHQPIKYVVFLVEISELHRAQAITFLAKFMSFQVLKMTT
jgi:hypothetical protein